MHFIYNKTITSASLMLWIVWWKVINPNIIPFHLYIFNPQLLSFSFASGTAGCDCYTESHHLPSYPFCYFKYFPRVLSGCNIVSLQRGEVRVTCLCCGFTFHHTKHIVFTIPYHFLSLYWVTQFIMACTITTLVGIVAACYWVRGEIVVQYTPLSSLSAISLSLRL